jgi:hypothetical protein
MTDTRSHAQLTTDDLPLRVPGEPSPAERVRAAMARPGDWDARTDRPIVVFDGEYGTPPLADRGRPVRTGQPFNPADWLPDRWT